MNNEQDFSLPEIMDMIDKLSKEPAEKFKQLNTNLGKLQDEYKENFKKLYDLCDELSKCSTYRNLTKGETTVKKGKCLEKLVQLLFQATGNYFKVYGNFRTSSNEIDCLFKLNDKGKILSSCINPKYREIICECKNHKGSIRVGYIGKFYSLISYLPISFGMFVSWDAISGKNKWEDSRGLIKKIFLCTMNTNQPKYIIDWNKNDFKSILDGECLFKILDRKLEELEMDCDISRFLINHHENEEEIKNLIKEMN